MDTSDGKFRDGCQSRGEAREAQHIPRREWSEGTSSHTSIDRHVHAVQPESSCGLDIENEARIKVTPGSIVSLTISCLGVDLCRQLAMPMTHDYGI